MNTLKSKEKARKYTLIEIVTVMAIIVILFAIVIGVIPTINKKRNDAKTQGILKALEIALENYKTQYGYYPQTPDGKVSEFYLDIVADSPGANSSQDIEKNFCKFIDYDKMIRDGIKMSDGRYKMLDGYGNPVVYRSPGFFNKGGFDIGSVGYNKKIGLDGPEVTVDNFTSVFNTGSDSSNENAYKNNFGKGDDLTNFTR